MSSPSLTVYAPAKVNLYLKIRGKRPDGYHDIETLFERVSLRDTLTFRLTAEDAVSLTHAGEPIPHGPSNLITRAASVLRPFRRGRSGVSVHVVKRIPVAAGLGGGSSDAAAALSALNRLWRCGLNRERLIELGRGLGADVPFFLHRASWGWGTGRGDDITPLPLSWRLWHVIVTPCVRLSAKSIYARVTSFSLTKNRLNVKILRRFGGSRSPGILLKTIACNDLTEAAVRRYPPLQNLLARLGGDPRAQAVFVSGSGPSVVVITHTRREAHAIAGEMRKRYRRVWVAATM